MSSLFSVTNVSRLVLRLAALLSIAQWEKVAEISRHTTLIEPTELVIEYKVSLPLF